MNLQQYTFATTALTIFIVLYEALITFLLRGLYRTTAPLWRSTDQLWSSMPLILGTVVLFAAWTTFMFRNLYPGGGMVNGLRFGIYLGIFAGILTAAWYFWLPVPAKLGWSWLIVTIAEFICGGLVLGLAYRK